MTHKELALIGGGVAVAAVAITIALMVSKGNPAPPPAPALTQTSAAVVPSPVPPPPPPKPRPTAPATTTSTIEFRDGWAVIPRPGKGIPDSAESRVGYMGAVTQAVSGEPRINKTKAQALMQRLRASFAKITSVPLNAIKVNVGDASVSLIVNDGVKGLASFRVKSYQVGACSEPFLGASILDAELMPADFAAAGARGLLCKSDGCTAIFDMRPTSSGGGLYGGPECLTLEQVVTLSGK